MAAIRPEFRADVLEVEPVDPVFGGSPCRVLDCERIARCNGMCLGHDGRWRSQGKPELERFIASTAPQRRGHAPLQACLVSGCRFGQRRAGLCLRHSWLWDRAGRPELAAWLAGLPAVDLVPTPPTCRIAYCDLWTRLRGPRRGALCETELGATGQARPRRVHRRLRGAGSAPRPAGPFRPGRPAQARGAVRAAMPPRRNGSPHLRPGSEMSC